MSVFALWCGDIASELDQLDGCEGGIPAFVPGLCACTFESLFERFGGKNAECGRDSRLQRNLSYPLGDFPGDIVEMGGIATNHASQTDDGIERLAGSHQEGDLWNFKRTGAVGHGEIMIFRTVTGQAINGTIEEAGRDQRIESADHNAETNSAGSEFSLEYVHRLSDL